MIKWIKKLISGKPIIEDYRCCKYHSLKRQRIEDIKIPIGDWRWGSQSSTLVQYRYWCFCGTELTDGPRGGAAVCAVCEKCKINYGADLPGYWGH